jgi:tetratricopeptide (TPR) repeat protein
MGFFDAFRPRKKEPSPDYIPPVNKPQNPNKKEAEMFTAKAFALMQQGFTSENKDLIKEALLNVNKALDLDPNCYNALEWKAGILGMLPQEDKSHFVEALACYERLLALKKDQASLWFNKAGILEQLGRDREALEAFEKSYALEPNGYSAGLAQVARGRILEKAGSNDDALRLYRTVPTTDIHYGEALCATGHIMESKGRKDDALDRYRTAARMFNQQKHFQDAVASYDHILALEPSDNDALFRKGMALNSLYSQSRDAGLQAKAETCIDEALAHDPENTLILTAKGNCLLNRNQFAESLEYFDRALARSPADKSALGYKGLVLWRLMRYDDALAIMNQLCTLDPHVAGYWSMKAYIRNQQGDNEQGLKDIDEAIKYEEQDPQSWALRAAFLRNLGRIKEAEEAEATAKKCGAR